MTVIDCPNIAGAKAPIAPVLNTPLQALTCTLVYRVSFIDSKESHQHFSSLKRKRCSDIVCIRYLFIKHESAKSFLEEKYVYNESRFEIVQSLLQL